MTQQCRREELNYVNTRKLSNQLPVAPAVLTKSHPQNAELKIHKVKTNFPIPKGAS